MKILLTGANGLVGQEIIQHSVLNGTAHCFVALGKGPARLTDSFFQLGGKYRSLDFSDGTAVYECILQEKPAVIIHGAAVTQVDQAETNPILAWSINVTATRFLLMAAEEIGAKVIHLSTDFVFSGLQDTRSSGYVEEDSCEPVNYYGSTKRAAEKAVADFNGRWLILRPVLILAPLKQTVRPTLLSWAFESLKMGESIRVVNDQFRNPTWAPYLAQKIVELSTNPDHKFLTGIFHVGGNNPLTPFQIVLEMAKRERLPLNKIEAVDSNSLKQKALRPTCTYLNSKKAQLAFEWNQPDLWELMYP